MKKRILSIAFVAVLLASLFGALVPSPVLAAYPNETWISPDSAYDGGGGDTGWVNIGSVIDGNTGTYARSNYYIGSWLWSNWIVMPITSMYSQKVRFYPGDNTYYAFVQVYWGDAWHTVHDGSVAIGMWNESSLGGTYAVTNARMKVRPVALHGAYFVHVHEFQYQEAHPLISTLEAENVVDDEVTLNGNLTDLAGESPVYAYYQWDTDTSYGNDTAEQSISSTGIYHQDLSGFEPGEVYHYRAAVRYDTNKYWYGDDKTFSFASPSADSYSADDIATTTAALNGYLTSLGDYTVAYIYFQWGVGAYTESTDEQTYTSAGPVTDDIDTLTPGETYQFRIRVRYSGADYVNGGQQTFQTLSAAPSNPSATPTEDYNELLLTWTKGEGAAETVIRASTTDFPATYDAGRLVYQDTGTSYVDSSLAGGVTYYYSFWSFTGGEPSAEHAEVSNACSILPGRTEYYNEGDTTAVAVSNTTWASQTFTATWQHNIESVSLLLYRSGTPGIVSVSIMLVDTAGYPVGDYLATGTLNGNLITEDTYGSWYGFSFTTIELETDEQYAVVIRSAASGLYVRYDASGEYDGGIRLASSDSAFSWTKYPDTDILFETYSKYLFSILDARVFSSYIEDNDWLIVFTYQNLFRLSGIPSEHFDIRLLDGEVVLAQTKLAAWGYRPGSIYICANEAAPLAWRSGYTIRMRARFTDELGNRPTTNYTLRSMDWGGDDLTLLDKWVLSRANDIGDFYTYEVPVGIDADGNIIYNTVKTKLTGYTTGTFLGIGAKEKLNDQGAAMFLIGIPMLDSVRSDLFLEAPGVPGAGEPTFTHEGDVIDWETELGEDTVEMATDWGNVFGMGGKQFAQIVGFGIILLITCIAAVKIGVASLFITALLLIAGTLAGLFPIAALMVGVAIIVLFIVWMVCFRGVS